MRKSFKNITKVFLRHSRYSHKFKFGYYFFKAICSLFDKYFLCCTYCSVCDGNRLILYYPLGDDCSLKSNYKESGLCFSCGSSHRNRSLWNEVKNNLKGNIYLPAGDGFLYHRLQGYSSIIFSDYYDNPKLALRNIPHQDLTKLTFDDNSFNLILSEHVLEHVSDPNLVFKEIYRCLKNGGLFVFTIPFEANDKSITRIDSNFNEHLPRKFHLDPLRSEGSLVFNDFSKNDFLDKFITKKFSSKVILEDIKIINGVEVISEVVILRK